MKIHLYFFGKPRDPHANAMAEDYMRRISHYAKAEMIEIRAGRSDPWAKHPGARKILLDPAGKTLDSKELTGLFDRDVVFIVGGADGLPPALRARGDLLLSLSALTMPHELARVVLAEQLYRALTTLRGHPYPR